MKKTIFFLIFIASFNAATFSMEEDEQGRGPNRHNLDKSQANFFEGASAPLDSEIEESQTNVGNIKGYPPRLTPEQKRTSRGLGSDSLTNVASDMEFQLWLNLLGEEFDKILAVVVTRLESHANGKKITDRQRAELEDKLLKEVVVPKILVGQKKILETHMVNEDFSQILKNEDWLYASTLFFLCDTFMQLCNDILPKEVYRRTIKLIKFCLIEPLQNKDRPESLNNLNQMLEESKADEALARLRAIYLEIMKQKAQMFQENKAEETGNKFAQMCLDNEINDNHRQRQKRSRRSRNQKLTQSEEKASIFSLPIEMIVLIGLHLLNSNKDKKSAVKDFLNFAQVIKGDKRFEGQDIRTRNLRDYMDILSDDVSPFAVAKKLKIELSSQEKEHYKNLAIKNECKKRNISPEQLNQWLVEHSGENYVTFPVGRWVPKYDYAQLLAALFNKKIYLNLPNHVCKVFPQKPEWIEFLALLTVVNPDQVGEYTALGKAIGWWLDEYSRYRHEVVDGSRPAKDFNYNPKELEIWAEEFVDILLAAGADPDLTLGETRPLKSGKKSHLGSGLPKKVMEKLLRYGADPNNQEIINYLGLTLHNWVREDKSGAYYSRYPARYQRNLTDLLIPKNNEGERILERLRYDRRYTQDTQFKILNYKDWVSGGAYPDYTTPVLIHAAKTGALVCLWRLINHIKTLPANLQIELMNAKDKFGVTPLIWAVDYHCKNGGNAYTFWAVELILETLSAFEPRAKAIILNAKSIRGQTALSIAKAYQKRIVVHDGDKLIKLLEDADPSNCVLS